MPTKTNGATVRRLREDKGITIAQLARDAGLTRDLVWKIEHAKINGSPQTRKALADALNVTLDDITSFTPPPSCHTSTEQVAA
jgi:transcriptional regulator with XRE-family HTH domain